jgi:OmpA-OmpF porin, OOP family
MVKTVATFQLAVLMSAAVVFASSAKAAGPDGSGVYLGVGAGVGHANIDQDNINASLLSLGFTNPSTSTDESSVAYKIFAGYSFNRYIAVEGGYFNLGKFSFDSTVTPAGTLNGQVKTYGFNLDAVGSLPLTQTFSIFARGGVQNAKSTVNYTGTGSVLVLTPQTSETKTSWDAGAGVAFEFANGKVGVRVEWELYRVPDGTNTDNTSNVNVFGVSVYSKF